MKVEWFSDISICLFLNHFLADWSMQNRIHVLSLLICKPCHKNQVLFVLMLYVPVNCFSVMLGWVFLG